MQPWLLAILIAAECRMAERRNRNALLELSDDQLKDIGLSRGQTESDVDAAATAATTGKN
jgi:uncharacterized protein YjiS (DUF1127 family)